MAERIVSPGVFTSEKDLSFLPQGVGEIGAALIGPTDMGPAFVPTLVRNFAEFEKFFGKLNEDFYVPFTAKEYLRNAGAVTIVRVLGINGYKNDNISIMMSGSTKQSADLGSRVVAILKPSKAAGGVANNQVTELSLAGPTSCSFVGGDGETSSSALSTIQIGPDDTQFAFSMETGSANYIENVFSTDPQDTNNIVYLAANYKSIQSQFGLTTSLPLSMSLASGSDDFTTDYSVATTPFIQSQLINSKRTNLFKVNTRSHGTNINSKYKIGISDVREAADIANSDFGDFTLTVQINNPGESNDGDILETFNFLSLDENADNYFVREIGDKFTTIDSNGNLTNNGDFPNKSAYIYISDFANTKGMSEALVPMGFGEVFQPFGSSGNSSFSYNGTLALTGSDAYQNGHQPSASFKINQLNDLGQYDENVFYGFDFSNDDSKQYLQPLAANSETGSNVVFSLENMLGDNSAPGATNSDATENVTLALSNIKQRKFVVPFQGGFDGLNPAVDRKSGTDITGTNTQGFDLDELTSSGSTAYIRAINAISNPDEFDINLLSTPGVVHEYHDSVTNHAITKMENRADAFYIMDGSRWGRSIDNAVQDIKTLDSNYVATYYPWVKISDPAFSKPTWVPPSVVMPGVYAKSDSLSHEWFAPAGLNRGGLTSVVETKGRLTHSERDTLYENRINPIAQFPAQGVVVFGQKTLQGKPSALDRVNVRRLLIRVRKFIASTSRFLVFEQNTATTRNRFLNIVNPFLEQVQANSGLSAFRVVMDESNNTPDVVDRNQLVGQIFLQPTRTAEFIVLDFVVQPSGAAFAD